MMPEVLNNPNIGNLLRGASIILSMEPNVLLEVALQRSKAAESSSDDELSEATKLIMKVAGDLELNGEVYSDRVSARKTLGRILEDPPWNRISEKHDLP